jgi:c-di-GMP-binding flagellar brake protein YcgR
MGLQESIENHLEVGAVAVLSFDVENKNATRYKSTIRGWTRGGYIVLDMPSANDKPFRLSHMQPCVARFVVKGRACGFDSKVLEGQGAAQPYLHLAWPEKVEIIQMRRYERIDVACPCVINLASGDLLHGAVRDLSAGGCRMEAKVGLRVDERFLLTFSLPDGRRVEDVPTQVRNARRLEHQALYGCQFLDLPDIVRDDIEFYITAKLEQLRSGTLAGSHVLIADSVIERAWPIHEAIESFGFYAFTTAGVLDLFYRLRFAPPAVLLISADQRDAHVADLIRIIHAASGFEKMPIIVYGGGGGTAAELSTAGACCYFPDLQNVDAVVKKIRELVTPGAEDDAAAQAAAP